MHLSLALLVLLFSLILSNVINRVFPRLPLPLIQIIFGVGIGFLLKGRAFELETELFLAFIIAPVLFREGEESDITSILRNWKLILFLIFPVIFVSTLGNVIQLGIKNGDFFETTGKRNPCYDNSNNSRSMNFLGYKVRGNR